MSKEDRLYFERKDKIKLIKILNKVSVKADKRGDDKARDLADFTIDGYHDKGWLPFEPIFLYELYDIIIEYGGFMDGWFAQKLQSGRSRRVGKKNMFF